MFKRRSGEECRSSELSYKFKEQYGCIYVVPGDYFMPAQKKIVNKCAECSQVS